MLTKLNQDWKVPIEFLCQTRSILPTCDRDDIIIRQLNFTNQVVLHIASTAWMANYCLFNQIELLWSDIRQAGWEAHVRYHWQLMHRPQHGLIRSVWLQNYFTIHVPHRDESISGSCIVHWQVSLRTIVQQMVVKLQLSEVIFSLALQGSKQQAANGQMQAIFQKWQAKTNLAV